MQKFFNTSIVSKFIKYLLMTTPIPTCSFLHDGDIMVDGNYYIYQGKLYKCIPRGMTPDKKPIPGTGIFKGSKKEIEGKLFCSETVYCSENLKVTDQLLPYNGRRLATYEVMDLYKEGYPLNGFMQTFISSCGYYDSETHRRLGDYLRFLKSTYNLDLMALYNCFSNKYVEDVDLTSLRLREGNNYKYKTTLVPIKFNRTYTIAFNSDFPVYVKPVLYNDKLIRTTDKKAFVYDNHYTHITELKHSKISQPFNLSVWNTDGYAQTLEKHLYLAIQLPKSVTTPIIVLEGEYSNTNYQKVYDKKVFTYSIDNNLHKLLASKCSLLLPDTHAIATGESPPFSDKLIAYLLQHTVDTREVITNNVVRITDHVGVENGYAGSWTNNIRSKLFDKYMSLEQNHFELNYEDILGYLDKDIENAMNKGLL